jgi:superfamily II DNA/RNA helicase
MPGVAEINKVITAIRSYDLNSLKKKVKLLALHGNLSPSEQRNVFSLAGRNEVKVVISTNVAEASVTIPDVKSEINLNSKFIESYTSNIFLFSGQRSDRQLSGERNGFRQ